MSERWLPVVGYEGLYEVSDLGSVRSRNGHLRFYPTRAGHLRATLSSHNHVRKRFVHRLVLEAFVGPRPEGMECRHIDGNPKNNAVSNLAWGTKAENMADRARHGHDHRGEDHPHAKLTAEVVREIRSAASLGVYHRELAKIFDVGRHTITDIVNRKTWRHVPDKPEGPGARRKP